jgi:UDP-glucose 4-epimerase
MKAVLLGGSGFIGTHLAAALTADGQDVLICDERPPVPGFADPHQGSVWVEADVYTADSGLLAQALQDADVVYHLAWRHLPAASNQQMEAEAQANVPGTLRLLRLCVEAGVGRLVFFSSGGTVYGPAQYLPIPETHPTEPLTAHAISKLAVEKYLALFDRLHGLDYVILRPGNPFGPGQSPAGGQGVIAAFLARTAAGLPLEVWGDGSVTRDYFYVGDLARAALLAGQTPHSRTVYNVGSGVGRSLRDLIAGIEQMLGRTSKIPVRGLEVHWLPGRVSDAPVNVLDVSKARRLLGWEAETPFEEGLRRMWETQAQRPSGSALRL